MLNKLKSIRTLFLIIVLATTGLAATQSQGGKSADQSDIDIQTLRQLRGKVFELKYGDPEAIASMLRPLGSGYKGAEILRDIGLRIISVRDFPENLAAM